MAIDASLNMNELERFLACCECKPVDRVPNHEVGIWAQTLERWRSEGIDETGHNWDWFTGDPAWGMDQREYIPVNYGMIPPFERKVLEEDEETEVIQHPNGVVTRALKKGAIGGARMSMDTYLRWPVQSSEDFRAMIAERYIATDPRRYPEGWREKIPEWKNRTHPLILGTNCSTLGFYWRAREWMGTEPVSFGWMVQPDLMHEMMEFIADFTIAVSKPVLDEIDVDYVFINEDMAMKNGPLLGPNLYKEYILPHMKRLVDWLKANGARYVVVDSDGNSDLLIPLLIEAGVDGLWPMERASDMDPIELRRKYGKNFLLWGGVDKREIAKGPDAIDAHLRTLAPLIEEGGFIPTVDHTVPPDVSLENFEYYMRRKQELLRGEFS